MPYLDEDDNIDEMKRFILATDNPLGDDEYLQESEENEEDLEVLLEGEEESSPNSKVPEMLDELRNLVEKWEWHRELNESEQYSSGYEEALAEAADRLRDFISKHDEGY